MMIALLLSVVLAFGSVSPTSTLVLGLREVRGDTIATSQVLNHMAAARVGWPGHDGLGAACPSMIRTVRVTACGEIKAWVTIADPYAAVRWAVPAWLASPPHHRVMLGHWRWIGVAIRRIGPYTWLVADFAR
jgi:hypothetical protein